MPARRRDPVREQPKVTLETCLHRVGYFHVFNLIEDRSCICHFGSHSGPLPCFHRQIASGLSREICKHEHSAPAKPISSKLNFESHRAERHPSSGLDRLVIELHSVSLGAEMNSLQALCTEPVSYTHLTLPTIYSV